MSRYENKDYGKDSVNLPDLICLSHLRWDFVFQRPQHLLSRFAQERRVFFIEEPVVDRHTQRAYLDIIPKDSGVVVVIPRLPDGLEHAAVEAAQEHLLSRLFAEHHIADYILWYYTPMALGFTRQLKPQLIVYDCMDELSMFKFAHPLLAGREAELLQRADIVFTGGASLYEHKRKLHPNVHLFPSSIDKQHFSKARNATQDPIDQGGIPHPRLGFFGVIDERMDLELLSEIAVARPNWHLVMIGPVAKIDPQALPKQPNIHYLGSKSYKELPTYLAGWDVAMLPFARNDSTRFVSPTKTPEYLAGGKPVISTPIRDVVHPYGERGLVWIADDAKDFVATVDAALESKDDRADWLRKVDEFLADNSWDLTWSKMRQLIQFMISTRAKEGVDTSAGTTPAFAAGD